jgi:hypothetical protein
MYTAYLFNARTGNIVNVTSPEEKYAFLIRPDWEEITEKEYERIDLAVEFALENQ